MVVVVILLIQLCGGAGNTLHVENPAATLHLTQHTPAYLDNVLVRQRLMRLVILGVLQQDLVHVGAGILVQLVGAAEDN